VTTPRAPGLLQTSRADFAYRGRFAPSPTGPLHFGSLVAAVASYLDARAASGEWRVRIEDVDVTRTVPGAADRILGALDAFGLHWDGEVVRQSERTERYREAFDRLRRGGVLYRCRCSRREIADSALAGVEGPIYPGTCRGLALGDEIDGADRIIVPEDALSFLDRHRGPVTQDLAREIGDFVLRRRDGLFSYQLAVVVDDADQAITDVVRGGDLLLSTPRQILLQRRLSLPTPRYLHVPVATDREGLKLSKQTHAAPVDPDRPAPALRQALAFLGQPIAEAGRPDDLLAAAVSDWRPSKIPSPASAPVTYGDGS
jgi:glutamyl-Q tRNA(Asp) synthetase